MRNLTTRLFIILLTITYLTYPTFAQTEDDPVSWSFEYKSVNNSSNEYELRCIADIYSGWYIYSQTLESRPPIPTSFIFEKNIDDFVMIGEVEEEGDLIVKYDEIFEKDIPKYTNKVIFKSKIMVSGTKTVQIKGRLEYMSCDASTCNPPTQVEFLFEINPTENTPLITNNDIGEYKINNSPSYSVMDRMNNSGMTINVPEGPVELRISNSNTYKETKVDIALEGSENIVNEDKERIIDEEDGGMLVAANISSYLKKKKKKAKKAATPIASRTIQKEKKATTPSPTIVSNPVKWNFELEKGENSTYNLVFKADVEDKWILTQDVSKLSFDNAQSIAPIGEQTSLETTEDGKFVFKQDVKFRDNVMLTGKFSYMITDPAGKTMSREASFAFNQSGEVITYQNQAGWWIGSIVALLSMILLTLVWKARKTLFQ